MPTVSRRKPRVYRGVKSKPKKTDRTELSPEGRAFAAGAAILGGVTHGRISKFMPRDRSKISKLIERVILRSEEAGLPVYDPYVFANEPGRGKPDLLTQEQKNKIVEITRATHYLASLGSATRLNATTTLNALFAKRCWFLVRAA
ncbi:hypothetical protein CC80DRAFT_555815 [Byssothecium circinans]|uniref:Uncharacterized protein n=1 Tax=Byssothecium circinans TaxID=147558 RepID=A0A6A5TJ87_9PLEO|nr:hypothetical protein CC80DRAFT_555815 [Byssothecium circinans]